MTQQLGAPAALPKELDLTPSTSMANCPQLQFWEIGYLLLTSSDSRHPRDTQTKPKIHTRKMKTNGNFFFLLQFFRPAPSLSYFVRLSQAYSQGPGRSAELETGAPGRIRERHSDGRCQPTAGSAYLHPKKDYLTTDGNPSQASQQPLPAKQVLKAPVVPTPSMCVTLEPYL